MLLPGAIHNIWQYLCMKIMNKKINMGFSQQTFNFEQSHEQNSTKEVLAFIDSTIADNGQVTFEQVASHFSMQSDRWTKPLIRNLINDLFNDDKIHFIIDGKKILSENIKILLSEPARSQSKFMRIKETLSIAIINCSLFKLSPSKKQQTSWFLKFKKQARPG